MAFAVTCALTWSSTHLLTVRQPISQGIITRAAVGLGRRAVLVRRPCAQYRAAIAEFTHNYERFADVFGGDCPIQ